MRTLSVGNLFLAGALIAGGCAAEAGGTGSGGGFGGAGGPAGSGGFAASSGNGGIGGVGSTSGAGGISGVGGGGFGGDSCAGVRIGAGRVVPTVQLVIDGSGSMDQGFGGGSRWSAVNDALLGPNGVVRRLEGVVRFGMAIYQTGDQNSCPLLTGPAPDLNNFMAINAAWLPRPGGSTPTGEAMESVVASMSASGDMLDTDTGPQIIILATDGAPNGCAGGAGNIGLWVTCTFLNPMDPACAGLNTMLATDGYVRTLAAAVDAQMKGIDVYVLDLSDGGANRDELQKVANVGVGLPEAATPPAPLYAPADPAALSSALETIIGGAATCQLALQGMITNAAAACSSGNVLLNSAPLSCDNPDGWRVVDATHIELVGQACTEWLNNPASIIDATFSCTSVVPD